MDQTQFALMSPVVPVFAVIMAFFFVAAMIVFLPRRRFVGVVLLALFLGSAAVFSGFFFLSNVERVPMPTEVTYESRSPMIERMEIPRIRQPIVSEAGKIHMAEISDEKPFAWIAPGHPAPPEVEVSGGIIPARLEQPNTDPLGSDPIAASSENATTSNAIAKTVEVPAWVKEPPRPGENGEFSFVLTSDPFDTPIGCRNDMAQRTRQAFGDLVREICRSRGYDEIPVEITERDVRDVSRERAYLPRETSMGEMTQLYQLTSFNDEVQTRISERVDREVARRRAVQVGALSGGALMMVGLAFGCCRFVSRNSNDPFAAS